MLTLEVIAEKLLACNELLLSTHISPDPDAIGSTFALAAALQDAGKKVSVHLAEPLSESLKALVPDVPFGTAVPSSKLEAFVVLDTAAKKRVGGASDTLFDLAAQTFNLDHHISNIGWAAHNYIDADAPATAVIVWELLAAAKLPVTPKIADLLYAGLLDDTGGFCFSNTNSKGFRCAAGLVDAGARPEDVSNILYFSQPLRMLKLEARVIDALEVLLNGKLSYIVLTRSMLEQCGCKPEDTEGVSEIARRVQGTEVSCFQRELDDGGWKMSLRAKTDRIDVNQIASEYGGGGHRAAAGCKLTGSEQEAKGKMVESIRRALENRA